MPKPKVKPPPKASILTGLPQPPKKMPRIVNANGQPFLRYKPYQPEIVSYTIRHRLLQKERWIIQLEQRAAQTQMATNEDDWDDIVAEIAQDEAATSAETIAEEQKQPGYQDALVEVYEEIAYNLNDAKEKREQLNLNIWKAFKRERANFELNASRKTKAESTATASKSAVDVDELFKLQGSGRKKI
jgi:hypothetical protein